MLIPASHIGVGDDEPGYYEVEKEDWVHSQSFAGAGLAVSQEHHGGESGPDKADASDEEPDDEEDLVWGRDEDEATQDEREAGGEEAVAQHTHRLEERDGSSQ